MNEEMNVKAQEPIENEMKEKQEKMFTQSQLEEIISKRLERERKTGQSLKEIKSMLQSAKKDGLIEGTSYAEMADMLLQKLKQQDTQNKDCTAENQSSEPCDNTLSDAADDGQDTPVDDKVEKITTERNEAGFFDELLAIKQRHSKDNVQRLISGDLFEKFAKGRNGRPSEIFDDFCLFMQGVDTNSNTKTDDDQNMPDPYSSTAFSNLSDNETIVSALTKQQMEMAKSAGLSYREYANILAAIPSGKSKLN